MLFEAAGNEPSERSRVLDAIDELVSLGMVKARGGDIYEVTESGKRAIAGRGAAKD